MPCKLLHLHSETSPAFESLNQKRLEESVPAACATQGYEPSRGAGVVEAVDKLVRQVEEQQEALERLNSAYASLVHERSLSAQLVVRLQHGLRTVSSKLALACMEETDKALLNVSESLVEINRLLADITETDSKVEGLSTISEARLAKPCASFEDSRGNSKLEVKMLEDDFDDSDRWSPLPDKIWTCPGAHTTSCTKSTAHRPHTAPISHQQPSFAPHAPYRPRSSTDIDDEEHSECDKDKSFGKETETRRCISSCSTRPPTRASVDSRPTTPALHESPRTCPVRSINPVRLGDTPKGVHCRKSLLRGDVLPSWILSDNGPKGSCQIISELRARLVDERRGRDQRLRALVCTPRQSHDVGALFCCKSWAKHAA